LSISPYNAQEEQTRAAHAEPCAACVSPSLSNNRITKPEKTLQKYFIVGKEKEKVERIRDFTCSQSFLSSDSDEEVNKYYQVRNYVKKQALSVGQNVINFIKEHGLNKVGFLTITNSDDLQFNNVQDWQESQRRFNSFRTHILKPMFKDYVIVLEPQQSGRIHYHMLVDCGSDIRSGIDFKQIEERIYTSANETLRGLWKMLRESSKKYGFGRTELLPIKKEGEAVGKYIGKYLSKRDILSECLKRNNVRKFGGRKVRYSAGAGKSNTRFAWASSKKYREAVKVLADFLGVDEYTISGRLGNSWNWKYRDVILGILRIGLTDEIKKLILERANFSPYQLKGALPPRVSRQGGGLLCAVG